MSAPVPQLTAEMVPLLQRGASTRHGRLFLTATEERQHAALVAEMKAAGFIFEDSDSARSALITYAGRRAVNGPTLSQLLEAEIRELSQ